MKEVSNYLSRGEQEQIGFERGVIAVRRKVSQESYTVFGDIFAKLSSKLGSAERFFNKQKLGVSIVRLSQLSSDILLRGRPTDSITERIQTAAKPLEVGLGRLALYGKKYNNHFNQKTLIRANLVVELLDDGTLEDEFRHYEKEYANDGMYLRNRPEETGYSPHCSIAVISANLGRFDDQYSLNRLSRAAKLGHFGQLSIKLNPVRSYDQATAPLVSTYRPLDSASNVLVGCCNRQTEAATPAAARV